MASHWDSWGADYKATVEEATSSTTGVSDIVTRLNNLLVMASAMCRVTFKTIMHTSPIKQNDPPVEVIVMGVSRAQTVPVASQTLSKEKTVRYTDKSGLEHWMDRKQSTWDEYWHGTAPGNMYNILTIGFGASWCADVYQKGVLTGKHFNSSYFGSGGVAIQVVPVGFETKYKSWMIEEFETIPPGIRVWKDKGTRDGEVAIHPGDLVAVEIRCMVKQLEAAMQEWEAQPSKQKRVTCSKGACWNWTLTEITIKKGPGFTLDAAETPSSSSAAVVAHSSRSAAVGAPSSSSATETPTPAPKRQAAGKPIPGWQVKPGWWGGHANKGPGRAGPYGAGKPTGTAMCYKYHTSPVQCRWEATDKWCPCDTCPDYRCHMCPAYLGNRVKDGKDTGIKMYCYGNHSLMDCTAWKDKMQ